MARWQAHLALADDEVSSVADAAAEEVPADRFGVITEVLEDGSDGAVVLSLDVEAGSLGGAINAALGQWRSLRSRGGLRPDTARLQFVVGPLDQPAVFHETIMLRARGLLASGQPSYAVVAAQAAFEVYVRGLFRDLTADALPPTIAALLQPRSMTLRDRAGADLFLALIGRRPTAAGVLWEAYQLHAQRRNGGVHEGAEVDEDAAHASLQAVVRLTEWIDSAASARDDGAVLGSVSNRRGPEPPGGRKRSLRRSGTTLKLPSSSQRRCSTPSGSMRRR